MTTTMTIDEIDDRLETLEAMPTGVAVKFHLPSLSDAEVSQLSHWAKTMRRHAFGSWLGRIAINEGRRRLAENNGGECLESRVVLLPVDWTDADVADALGAASALTYSTESPRLGQLFDAIYRTVLVLAQRRLRRN